MTTTAAIPAFILRIVASDEGRTGQEDTVGEKALVIGRNQDCDIVLADPSISRQHARVEAAPDGLHVTDLRSANGIWIDARRIVDEVVEPGTRFRIGSTVFESVPPRGDAQMAPLPQGTIVLDALPPPVADRTVFGMADGFSIKIVQAVMMDGTIERGDRYVEISGRGATLGRGEDCGAVFPVRDVSRHHAKVELLPTGFRLTDLGSSNGTWIDSRRIERSETLTPGQQFRLGSTTLLECHLEGPAIPAAPAAEPSFVPEAGPPAEAEPPPEAAPPAEDELPAAPAPEPEPEPEEERPMTVSMPISDAVLAQADHLKDEGEKVVLDPHRPLFLNDPGFAWYVVSGGVDIFTVDLENGRPHGTRSHFLEIQPAQCFFGFDVQALGSGFIGLGKQNTELRKIPVDRLRRLTESSATDRLIAELLDGWVAGLSRSLAKGIEVDSIASPLLKVGKEIALASGRKACSAEGVVWVELWGGSALFNDLGNPQFARARSLFPVTPESWIEQIGDEFGDLTLSPIATIDAIKQAAFWEGLAGFHDVLCECEFIEKGLRKAEEKERLEAKKHGVKLAGEEGRRIIERVMHEGETPDEFRALGSVEPVLRAFELIGKHLGVKIKNHPGLEDETTFEQRVSAIARASGCRTRVVALREKWWKKDHGPLLGQFEESNQAVAILPVGARGYRLVDPATSRRVEVTAEVAEKLSSFAYTIYRPFPDRELSVLDVVRFGIRGLAGDFRLLIAMGVTIGLFGTMTPFLTGKIFDGAIPQADRGMLIAFGLALLLSALASMMFKLTQGVATLRVQGKAEYAVQSALWNRLLDLPTNFFRQYSAGDLADRAAGVDRIQSLMSGAGVAAILGSFSGLFYVFLMFTYDTRLTLLAIALTVFFVGFTTLANYLQLRHQRVEIGIRGKITGLVLNLITGVSKLRISGTENFAFRIWAENFSTQKRIAFKIGRIQNVVTVFNSVFPVLSSMAIFMLLLSAQRAAAESGTPPTLTTGDFIAFTAAYGLFLTAMQALGDASLNMLRVVPVYERLKPIVTTQPETDESKAFPGRLEGGIDLSHVSFRYIPNGPWIIKDLSLTIEPGEFVAFVGGSGSGKSTLLRILLGFERPERGIVRYDGQDLSSVDLRMLREQLGVVLQVSRVLPAEMYRNIVGVSSKTIEDAWEAAEKAGLADDIRAMPMQMHTYVAEGGGTLSGGQRQRLMIARAIVNRPKVLFLDEATSALDNKSQAIVSESMDRMDATRIVIAHRLSTIINADKICYLDRGRIAEQGTYQELMAKNDLFASLAKRQMA